MSNMELWNKVEKTDPAYTKGANVKGNKITAISPQYQIMKATEQFGAYGSTWGFKSLELDYTLMAMGLVTFKGVFFYTLDGAIHEFPIINSAGLYKDNLKTKIDDDFAKKVETDALTKALSNIGFNADIFLGKFDDVKYVRELEQEKEEEEEKTKETPEQIKDRLILAINKTKSTSHLADLERVQAVKDARDKLHLDSPELSKKVDMAIVQKQTSFMDSTRPSNV